MNVTSNHDDITNLSLLVVANVTNLQSKDEEIEAEMAGWLIVMKWHLDNISIFYTLQMRRRNYCISQPIKLKSFLLYIANVTIPQ